MNFIHHHFQNHLLIMNEQVIHQINLSYTLELCRYMGWYHLNAQDLECTSYFHNRLEAHNTNYCKQVEKVHSCSYPIYRRSVRIGNTVPRMFHWIEYGLQRIRHCYFGGGWQQTPGQTARQLGQRLNIALENSFCLGVGMPQYIPFLYIGQDPNSYGMA